MSQPAPPTISRDVELDRGHGELDITRDAEFAAAIEQLPKVELHCHLEGTMRPQTLVELAARNGLELPLPSGAEQADLTALFTYVSLDDFLRVFWLVQSALVSRDDWTRLAYESVVDAAAHGRIYAEVFFTPARHLDSGQRLADIIAGIDEGMTEAEAVTGSRVRLIADMDRAFGAAAGEQMVTELVALRRAGAAGCERVIGIGMDSTELGVDPRDYEGAYRAAAAGGLRRTAHQGENSGPDAIAMCVDVLGAERIDHGLSLLDDAALTMRFATEQVPLTVCPLSNVLIANAMPSLAEHPYPAMRAAGLLATLNTDDPGLTLTNLGQEYREAAEAFGYDLSDMVAIAADGVRASWLSAGEKSELIRDIEKVGGELGRRTGERPVVVV
jgi:adenosine deaminase